MLTEPAVNEVDELRRKAPEGPRETSSPYRHLTVNAYLPTRDLLFPGPPMVLLALPGGVRA